MAKTRKTTRSAAKKTAVKRKSPAKRRARKA